MQILCSVCKKQSNEKAGTEPVKVYCRNINKRAYLIYSGKLKAIMVFLKAISMPEELLSGFLHIPELPLRCL